MMRVTNSMIVKQSKTNINYNRVQVDRTNNQMATQKKIVKPSDNPIIAIRSLRLRSALSTITQYYGNNIPDTESWMDVTETALTNMKDIVTDAYEQVVYGTTDSLNQDNRKTILKELKALQEQIYSEGDSDYAGRTVFTGYKTNQTLTFLDDAEAQKAEYQITERFNYKDIEQKKYYANGFSNTSTDILFAVKKDNAGNPILDANGKPIIAGPELFTEESLNRVRLSYDKIEGADATLQFNLTDQNQNINVQYKDDGTTPSVIVQGITFTDDTTAPALPAGNQDYTVTEDTAAAVKTYKITNVNDSSDVTTVTAVNDANGNFDHWKIESAGGKSLELKYEVTDTTSLENADYKIPAGTIVLDKERGELIFDNAMADKLNEQQSAFTFTYEKKGFEIGELRPENYFDCIKHVSNTRDINYKNYDNDGNWISEAIYYNIAGGQQMQINTEARDVFNSDIRRDLDDLTEIVQTAIDAQTTVDELQEKLDSGIYDEDPEKLKALNDWMDMAKKQLSYANQNMHDTYSAYITNFKGYLNDVNLAITDIGGRGERVSLTKNRMSIQESTFKDLKSTNEDMDLSELVINYSAATVAYQAALQAAAKIDKMTLLNYL